MSDVDAEAARALFAAAQANDRQRLRDALARLAPAVQGYVRALMLRPGRISALAFELGVRADELESVVLEKLTRSPPTRDDGAHPRASLLAWIKSVTLRELIDRGRKATRRGEELVPSFEAPSASTTAIESPQPDAQRILVARAELDTVQFMLRECFPQGLAVVDEELGSARPDAEIAEALGISVTKLQADRSRMHRYARAYRVLGETPEARNEVVARAMDVALTDNVTDIINRVRIYVRREMARGRRRC